MTKAITIWTQQAKSLKNAASKFTPTAAEGSRLIPSRNKDSAYQCRIDAGRYDPATKKLNVVMQINSQAKSPVLTAWARKHSTHDKLAVETFDTAANDKKAEYNRMLESLANQAKSKLG